MSSIPVPRRSDGGSNGSRPSLPALESPSHRSRSRDDRPESGASGSRRSGSKGDSQERAQNRLSMGSTTDAKAEPDSNGEPTLSRRTSQRSSGGFLLDSVRRSSRIPQMAAIASDDPKGKRKREESQLIIPKRRTRQAQIYSGSSLTSSPLATEVHRESIHESQNGNGPHILGTDVRHSTSSPRPTTTSSGGSEAQHLETKRPSPPTFGYATDPSQIVNMALSLGEARRRHASARRYVSTDQTGRRIVSTVSTTPSRSRIPTGSIAKYLSPPRRTSVSVPTNGRPQTPQIAQQEQANKALSPEDGMEIDDSAILDEAQISEATIARVQRAKAFFELAYEHRRLLSHLPPIRRPGAFVKSNDPDVHSKSYNPLQYVRNRKLRLWDKTPINAEAEGWHDVEKVRTWVDAVIGSHHENGHDPEEIVRLPLLSHSESQKDESHQDGSKERSPAQPTEVPKQRRPRSDWVTHPGDMLADSFWLEQGMNKVKIRDRDNNQIFPPNTQFRFSGWRNRTPVDVPANLQQPTPPPDGMDLSDEETLPLHSPAPQLPTFKSTQQTSGRGSNGRKRSKIKDSFGVKDESGNRRKGLKLFMDDTSDETGSDRSPGASDGDKERGRKRPSRKRIQKHSSSRSPGGEPLTTTNTKDSLFASTFSPSEKSQPSSEANSKRASIDHPRFGRFLKRDPTKGHTSLSRSQNRTENGHHDSAVKFPSFNDQPRSSGEYESTAPNSPVATMFPSIAINLESPPHSRSPSPTKKKASTLNPFRNRSQVQHGKVDTTDFADLSHAGSRKNSGEDKHHSSEHSPTASRGTSPMTREQSPLSKRVSHSTQNDAGTNAADHRDSTISRMSTKSTGPSSDHSRIRGMFKGGRIAELVGNEVSRVGEFIWKRDVPTGYRRRGSNSSEGTLSNGESEQEDAGYVNGDVLKTPQRPQVRSRRASTASSTKSEQLTSPVSSKSPPSGEKPKYNNPNLPSFTSPFERDKEAQQQKLQALLTPTTSHENRDHISRLAAEHRSTSRSPRLDRLAPPKLNTGGAPSPDNLERINSYGFGSQLNLARSKDASEIYNSAISEVGPGLNRAMMADGRSNASPTKSQQGSDLPQNVTRRDIDRAIALLLCSAVKAREIGRRADRPRQQTPKYLLETMAADGAEHHHVDLSLVSRREEHVVAARILMSRLSAQATALDQKMQRFSATTAPALHTELQTLEDLVDNKMTPRVRLSADEAGELSMKLTTTSTRAVKSLNDAIDGAFRRRRRGPIRWVRRGWYAAIEYSVVSLLWGIWAVVSFIRIFLGVFSCLTRTARWLLWID